MDVSVLDDTTNPEVKSNTVEYRVNIDDFNQAITITLKPEFYKLKPIVQYLQTSMKIVRYCKANGIKIYIAPELTPTGGNIHYHGVIKADNINKIHLLSRYLGRNIGYSKIKLMDNSIIWHEYMHKDKLWEFNESFKIINC